jgi:hypothetical protein
MKTFLAFLLLLSAVPARAGKAGALFLDVGAGSRAAGMGSAFTAAADDASASYWNPAGLLGVAKREAAATRAAWIDGGGYDHAAYAENRGPWAWSVALTHLSLGEQKGRGDDGSPTGAFSAGDSAVGLSFARPWGESLRGGVTLKYVRQRIADQTAAGLAADLGLLRSWGPSLTVGVAARNLGPSLSFAERRYRMPLALDVGAFWRPRKDWGLSADLGRRVYDGDTVFRLGTEYWALGRVAVRGGYAASGSRGERPEGEGRLSGAGFQMGLGVRAGGLTVDYALAPAGDFGDAHQVSVSVRF